MQSVMFISLGFYNYDHKIKETIENLGYEVTQFTPIGRYNTAEKLFNTLVKGRYLRQKSRRRQKKHLLNNPKKYDYVFVIVGRHLDPDILKKYRKMQPDAKFVLYLWDDIARVERYEENKPVYDEIYSFDLKDVQTYGVKHLPLFYTPSHEYHGEEKKYTLMLAGALHSERLAIWDKIVDKYKLDIQKCYLYLLGTKMQHFFQLFSPAKNKWMKPKHIRIRGMKFEEMAQIAKESCSTLDVQFGSQAGLTIRTFESLASHTKLITTNSYVKEYDFYKYGNICVIDRENPIIPQDFFEEPYHDIPEEIIKQYSLSNWVQTMLEPSKTAAVDTQKTL